MAATAPNDQSFHLQWNHFSTDVSNAFRQLRKDADFCDVTLGCSDSKGNSLKAHKVILSASSEKFQQILKEDYSQKEHPNPYIYLKGVAFSDLKLLLDFIYNGEVTLSKENLKSFLKVAKELEIRALCKNQGTSSNNTKDAKQNGSEKAQDSKDQSESKKSKKKDVENEEMDADAQSPPAAKSPKLDDANDSEMYPVTESPVRVDPETGMIPKSPERIDPETGFIPEDEIEPETENVQQEETSNPEAQFTAEEGTNKTEEENGFNAEEAMEPEPRYNTGMDFNPKERNDGENDFLPERNILQKEPEPIPEPQETPTTMELHPAYEEPQIQQPPEEINIFKCRLCEFECSKPKVMRNHLKKEHPEMINTNKAPQHQQQNTVKRPSAEEERKREKKNDINCNECFKLSGDIKALDRHIKDAHVKNKILRVTSDPDM